MIGPLHEDRKGFPEKRRLLAEKPAPNGMSVRPAQAAWAQSSTPCVSPASWRRTSFWAAGIRASGWSSRTCATSSTRTAVTCGLALFELEKIGIVRRIPNRGAVVRDLSPEEVSDIYDVREVLEVMALRILPLPVPPKSLATLEALQRQHSDAIDAGDFLAVHYSNVQFHRTLFSLCGNHCLIESIENSGAKGLKHSILRSRAGGCVEQLPARPRQ